MFAPTDSRVRRSSALVLAVVGLGLLPLLASACGGSAKLTGSPIKEAGIQCAQPRDIPTAAGKPAPDTVPTRPATGQVLIKDITPGTGATIAAGKQITVQYYVVSCGTGKQVYSTWDAAPAAANPSTTAPAKASTAAGPTKFLFKTPDVVPGWIQGLAGMKAGGFRRVIIPADLVKGTQGGSLPGGSGVAPANDTLIFYIQLDAVDTPPAPTTTTAPATTTTTAPAGATTTTTAPGATTTTVAGTTTTTAAGH